MKTARFEIDMNLDVTSAEIRRLRDSEVEDAIASLDLSVMLPEGKKEEQRIIIGRPLLVESVYVCQIQHVGPIRMSPLCVGGNAFQALNMALAIIRDALHKSVNDSGYQLSLSGSDKVMTMEFLDSVMFADDYIKQSKKDSLPQS